MNRVVPVLLGFLLFGVLGFLAGRMVGSGDADDGLAIRDDRSSGGDVDARRGARPSAESALPKAADVAAVEEPPVVIAAESDLFSAALLRHFDEQFRVAWQATRQVPLGSADVEAGRTEFEKQVLALPAALGEGAAGRANEVDAAARAVESGDGVAIIEAMKRGSFAPTAADVEGGLLDRVVEPRLAGKEVSGERFIDDKNARLTEGLVITFGPGIHALSADRLRREGHDDVLPADVTIQGEGMNGTLVMIDSDISARSHVERLRFRNLTLDCGDNDFFDLRTGVLTLDLENVRIVRFDMGAGGSLAFGVNQGAVIRARGCEFIGGFGRMPGSGHLFRGAACLALFDRCTFGLLDLSLRDASKRLVVFQNCRFEEFVEDPTTQGFATFSDCIVEALVPRADAMRRPPRSLGEFFPGWSPR